MRWIQTVDQKTSSVLGKISCKWKAQHASYSLYSYTRKDRLAPLQFKFRFQLHLLVTFKRNPISPSRFLLENEDFVAMWTGFVVVVAFVDLFPASITKTSFTPGMNMRFISGQGKTNSMQEYSKWLQNTLQSARYRIGPTTSRGGSGTTYPVIILIGPFLVCASCNSKHSCIASFGLIRGLISQSHLKHPWGCAGSTSSC